MMNNYYMTVTTALYREITKLNIMPLIRPFQSHEYCVVCNIFQQQHIAMSVLTKDFIISAPKTKNHCWQDYKFTAFENDKE